MTRWLMAAALTGLPGSAWAFCGYYAGSADASLYNHVSQVGIVRQGTRTTLTLANDVETNTPHFAILLPVPEVLSQSDVRVVSPELFPALDAYSAPRRVTYGCEDFRPWGQGDDYDAADGEGNGPPAEGVTVEAEFAAGEYEIVVLSATESKGLITWLQSNGYHVADEARSLLDEYIAGGSYFFAAKVALDRVPEGQAVLSPLQFGYDSDVFSLPIRIGTLSSPGEQDLIAYVLTDEAKGAVGISNYPEAELEDDCMWKPEESGGDFGKYYADKFAEAVALGNKPGWVREYSWSPQWCDPCSSDPPTEEQLAELGWSGDAAWFTRLHTRYTPAGATQDLVLYTSNDNTTDQVRFIDYVADLEYVFPVCGVGMVADPGECDFSTEGDADGDGIPDDEDDDVDGDGVLNRDDDDFVRVAGGGGLGCAVPPTAPASLLPLALVALLGRRRR